MTNIITGSILLASDTGICITLPGYLKLQIIHCKVKLSIACIVYLVIYLGHVLKYTNFIAPPPPIISCIATCRQGQLLRVELARVLRMTHRLQTALAWGIVEWTNPTHEVATFSLHVCYHQY